MKKTGGRKSSWTVPLSFHVYKLATFRILYEQSFGGSNVNKYCFFCETEKLDFLHEVKQRVHVDINFTKAQYKPFLHVP